MIIHYIQFRIISEKLKLFLSRTLNSCKCGLRESRGPEFHNMSYLVMHREIVYESIELDKKSLNAEAEWKLFGIIIDKDRL